MIKLKKPLVIRFQNYWLVWKSKKEFCKCYSKKAIQNAMILLGV